jgi:hypothetical protein
MTMNLKEKKNDVRSFSDLMATGARNAGQAGGAWR